MLRSLIVLESLQNHNTRMSGTIRRQCFTMPNYFSNGNYGSVLWTCSLQHDRNWWLLNIFINIIRHCITQNLRWASVPFDEFKRQKKCYVMLNKLGCHLRSPTIHPFTSSFFFKITSSIKQQASQKQTQISHLTTDANERKNKWVHGWNITFKLLLVPSRFSDSFQGNEKVRAEGWTPWGGVVLNGIYLPNNMGLCF